MPVSTAFFLAMMGAPLSLRWAFVPRFVLDLQG
jgi:hypothetical protein